MYQNTILGLKNTIKEHSHLFGMLETCSHTWPSTPAYLEEVVKKPVLHMKKKTVEWQTLHLNNNDLDHILESVSTVII